MQTIKDSLAQLPNRDESVRELMRELHLNRKVGEHLLSRDMKLIDVPEWNARLNVLLGAADGARETYGHKPLEVTIGRPAHWANRARRDSSGGSTSLRRAREGGTRTGA